MKKIILGYQYSISFFDIAYSRRLDWVQLINAYLLFDSTLTLNLLDGGLRFKDDMRDVNYFMKVLCLLL